MKYRTTTTNASISNCLRSGSPEKKEQAIGHACGRQYWRLSRNAVFTLMKTLMSYLILKESWLVVIDCTPYCTRCNVVVRDTLFLL